MEDVTGYSIDFVMIAAAVMAVPLTFERHALRDGASDLTRDVVRLFFLLIVVANAYARGEHWREWLYGLLMPLGAYYLVRALCEPLARWRADHVRARREFEAGNR